MALPLKSGADLYTQEIRRVALQNEGSDLPEYIIGSIYFNTNSANSNSSNRIRYRGLDTWHSVANYEDIEHLQNQIDNIDFASSEEFTSLKERVDAFLDGGVDSDDVLNNLKEIQAFLDAYDGATSLVDLLNAKADKEEFDSAIASITANFANYRLLTDGVFDVLINANEGIETNEITIGGIKLSVVDGHLCIDGDAYTTGQLASGGVAEDGGTSGGSGIVILEDWALLDDTQPQVVGAALGKDMYDRLGVAETNIEGLMSRATNVRFSQTLTSGKEIGIIYVDEDPTTLYAPATYSWSDITDKPSDIVDVSSIRSIAESALAKNSFDVLHAASINSDVVSTERLYADSLNGFTPITTGNHRAILDYVYAPYNAAGYLPLSGGTLTGTLYFGDGLYNGANTKIFRNASIYSDFGTLIVNAWDGGDTRLNLTSTGVYFQDTNSFVRTILHSGNVREYALEYAGDISSLNSVSAGTFFLSSYGATSVPEGNYAGGITLQTFKDTIGADYRAQLAFSTNANAFVRRYINGTWEAWKTLLHSDNIGNYAGIWVKEESFDLNEIREGFRAGKLLGAPNAANDNASYRGFLEYGARGYTAQFNSGSNNNLYYRWCENNTWSDWKTIAFTDSDISGNLVGTYIGTLDNETNPYLWLQENGGTKYYVQSYNGLLHLGSGATSSLIINSSGNVTIGGENKAGAHYKLWADGAMVAAGKQDTFVALTIINDWYRTDAIKYTDIRLLSFIENTRGGVIRVGISDYGLFNSMAFGSLDGSTYNPMMLINSSGNVTIGASDLATTNYKLYVEGNTNIAGEASFLENLKITTGKVYNSQFARGYLWEGTNGDIGGIYGFGFNGNALDYINITTGNYDSTNGICLKNSGNVGIGTTNPHARLDVAESFSVFNSNTGVCLYVNSSDDNVIRLAALNTEITSYRYMSLGYQNQIFLNSASLKNNYVGINNNNPIYQLDVSGTGRFTDAVTLENTLSVAGLASFNGGAYIPTGQTLKIGEATISWDGANSVLKVDKDFASDGQVSSGGIAEAASVITGSGLEKMVFTLVEGQTSYECEHNLGTREVTVCIYEEGDDYQQILTDVYLDDTNTARIVFGSVTDINHKVVIVG